MYEWPPEVTELVVDDENYKEAKDVVPYLIAAEMKMDVISVWVPIREPADGYLQGEYEAESER